MYEYLQEKIIQITFFGHRLGAYGIDANVVWDDGNSGDSPNLL